ncbi:MULTISPECIES: tyrosine-type recombinase/integrase [unclassified Microbacterium]|uniref:tyrosine-type recombinase/integrase n=1 Tax=unclassified Microbacterium TaxID=2609290 RepID=UPI00346601A9
MVRGVGETSAGGRSKVPRVRPHSLRHTAASLAVSAGAIVKAVQRMLGHASAAMTLDTYADLLDDDLNSVAVAPDRARSKLNVSTEVSTH